MSTITKERIANLLQFNSEGSDCQANAEQWEVHELALIALASLEAKSRKLFTCSGCGAEGLDEPLESKCHCNEDGAHWVESVVYTAPPAPVSVPDDVTAEDCPAFIKYDLTEVDEAWARGFNACRDAMLQGAEPVTKAYKLPFEQWLSQQTGTIDVECGCVMTEVFFHWLRVAYEAGNSPATPDGWVACSERMPDADGNYWGWWSESKRQGPVWFIKSELQAQFQSSEITHWMPLPAAPQQEV
ncbi:DUF551 domain-containing protein [Enterobacter cloacae]